MIFTPLLAGALLSGFDPSPYDHPDLERREQAARVLLAEFEADDATIERISASVARARELLGSGRPADLLRRAVTDAGWRAYLGEEDSLRELRAELGVLASDLLFRPLAEADLPEGFPPPTPIHAVELKSYPAYRLAVSPSSGAFGRLFRHITSNDIPMTAPVEMTYSEASGTPSEQTMAFLYESVDQGRLGESRGVRVEDAPAQQVLSIGVRGRRSDARLEEARAALDAWLADHPRFERAGDLRVFGYNSPMVPVERQSFEVQYPVRQRADD